MNEAAWKAAEVIRFARSLAGLESFTATGLVIWSFAQVGILLEDDLLILHRSGERFLGSDVLASDLIFRTGRKDRFHPGDHRYGVGHVGLCTGERSVMHASFWQEIVVEDSLDAFLDTECGHFRGIRRIIAR